MCYQGKLKEPILSKHYKWNDKIIEFSSYEDIEFFKNNMESPLVKGFCRWVEKKIIPKIEIDLNLFKLKEDMTKISPMSKKTINKDYLSVKCNIRYNILRKIFHREKKDLIKEFVDFLYKKEVLEFYERLSAILMPIIEIDLISLLSNIKKNNLNIVTAKKIEILKRIDFSFWAEKFVSTWYKTNTTKNIIIIDGLQLGPVVEYDLMKDFIVGFPEKSYLH